MVFPPSSFPSSTVKERRGKSWLNLSPCIVNNLPLSRSPFHCFRLFLTVGVSIFAVLSPTWHGERFKVSAFFAFGPCERRQATERNKRVKSVTPELSHVVLSFASCTVFLCLATQCLQLQLVYGYRCWGTNQKKSQSSSLDYPELQGDQCVAVILALGKPTSITHCRVWRNPDTPQPPNNV